MSKIKVEGYDTTYEPSHGLVSFALCSSPKEGRKQCMEFETCKAFLQDRIYSQVKNGASEDLPIDMNKLRLLVTGEGDGDKQFKERLYSAKRVVNFYEKIAGWKLSKIAKVDHSAFDKVWLITGPKQWMSSPQLISMVTLVLRMVTNRGPVQFKTNKDLESMYKDWIDENKLGDICYLTHCWDKLFLVMKHYNELFKGFTPEDLHISNRDISSHTNGINYLCQFKSGTEELNDRLQELYEKSKKGGEG